MWFQLEHKTNQVKHQEFNIFRPRLPDVNALCTLLVRSLFSSFAHNFADQADEIAQ